MAEYVIRYQSDFGQVFSPTVVRTFIVTPNGQQFSPPTLDFGLLPAIFYTAIQENTIGCDLPVIPRRIRAYLNDTDYLAIPCPFMGGTADFTTFLNQVSAINDVLLAVLDGESVNGSMTRILTGQRLTQI